MKQKVFREKIRIKGRRVQSETKHFSNIAFKYSQSWKKISSVELCWLFIYFILSITVFVS